MIFGGSALSFFNNKKKVRKRREFFWITCWEFTFSFALLVSSWVQRGEIVKKGEETHSYSKLQRQRQAWVPGSEAHFKIQFWVKEGLKILWNYKGFPWMTDPTVGCRRALSVSVGRTKLKEEDVRNSDGPTRSGCWHGLIFPVYVGIGGSMKWEVSLSYLALLFF